MELPPDISLSQAIEKMRESGCIPIGVLAFDMETDELIISVFRGVDPAEANALLAKLKIKGKFS